MWKARLMNEKKLFFSKIQINFRIVFNLQILSHLLLIVMNHALQPTKSWSCHTTYPGATTRCGVDMDIASRTSKTMRKSSRWKEATPSLEQPSAVQSGTEARTRNGISLKLRNPVVVSPNRSNNKIDIFTERFFKDKQKYKYMKK